MMAAALAERPCPACGRPELPAPSDTPPSDTLRAAMVEVLRFAQEYDAIDPEYGGNALTFADWLALSAAADGRGRSRVRVVRD